MLKSKRFFGQKNSDMKTKDINLIQEDNADILDDFVLGIKGGAAKKFKFSSIFAHLNANIWTQNVHPDDVYKHVNAGISTLLINANTENLPCYAGMLLHVQRWEKNDISATQYIFQIIFDDKGELFYRYGVGNGTKINYAEWKKIALEALKQYPPISIIRSL